MTTQRARRAAATALLAAGAFILMPAAAHADTCMTDDKGNLVCGASGSGPASGPGSYTGNNGVHDGTPGAIGPDGQPLAAATPPPWMAPGWTPPPVPSSAQPAPNGQGLSTVQLPPGQVPPGVNGTGAAPAGPQTTKELPPPAAGGTQGSSAATAAPTASASPSASAAPSASTSAAPVPTMTEMAQHSPPPSAAPAAPIREQTARTSEESSFNPGVLLAVIGGLAIAGAWFVPGIRSALTGLLRRGH